MYSFRFDEAYYLQNNPDVAAAVRAGTMSNPLNHYLHFGILEARAPCYDAKEAFAKFDELYYLEANPDVATAVLTGVLPSALAHYALYGGAEGRDPNADFDETAYRADHPDIAAAVQAGVLGSAYEHFLGYGRPEGRVFREAGTDAAGPRPSDILVGGDGDAAYQAGNGKDVVLAGAGNDTVSGSNGADRLYGEAGDDLIFGGNGPDRLYGGAGSDTMTGGEGPDVFSFDARPGMQQGIYGRPDFITDFDEDNDKIEFAFATEVISKQKISVSVQLTFVKTPADPVGKYQAIADAMCEYTRTDNAVSWGRLGDDMYILYEYAGRKEFFDPRSDILIVLTGFDGFIYEEEHFLNTFIA